MSKVAFILLHLGENHPPSVKLIKTIEESGVKAISSIYVGTDRMKKWLLQNGQGLVIQLNDCPCFLVAIEGKRTKVYPSRDVSKIIDMIKEFDV